MKTRITRAPPGRRKKGRGPALLLPLLCAAAFAIGAQAQRHDNDDAHPAPRAEDRAGLFSTIHVTGDRPAADVACAFCTVRVDGPVRGDVAVMFGTVTVGEDQSISGDTALLFSTLDLGEGAQVQGDLAAALSTVRIAPGGRIHGDRTILASGLGLAVVLGPVLILIGLVWLVVWILRRTLV